MNKETIMHQLRRLRKAMDDLENSVNDTLDTTLEEVQEELEAQGKSSPSGGTTSKKTTITPVTCQPTRPPSPTATQRRLRMVRP